MNKDWYVVHTYSGYENKVKINLEKRIESMGMDDKIFRVLVPEEEETETKNGKTKVVKHKVFPGYVLVELIMTDDSWYVVRNTPGVTGFVGSAGSGSKPSPMLDEEIERVFRNMGVEDNTVELDYVLGDTVMVKEGPFAEFAGKITEIDEAKGKARVIVDMFGRETPVEVDFDQIEKL
ncbi:transcription termination/antitermination protein NusG [Brochothrix thermosphacta]|uniref:Transcription termination/antitermination protein NusG n=2 Tax=Brochothrix TaxID=2755 RepID=A0A1D2L4X2_BROTH|nr:transcription termination/antitermination protein NusG [Brochothrix thermosphacta]SLM91409.1 Transcription antitermination protein NusG [Brachybacterium faecium]ANZ95062.1 transcription termination/antitermination protein NusG [Brochothrix thermosphacta]ANZ96635.1 transcription termination/antitermination protein NusG [Brochothrix thermosphacta]ATF26052.1 transcription termination/antitermination protein NusG [Brochothrix thermosphacta]ATH85392.1 transcription termination/antitermination pr